MWWMHKTKWSIQKEERAQVQFQFVILISWQELLHCTLLVWRVEVPTDCLDDGRIGMQSTISTIPWLKCTMYFIFCSVLLLINYFSRTHCLKCNLYFKIFLWFQYWKLLLKMQTVTWSNALDDRIVGPSYFMKQQQNNKLKALDSLGWKVFRKETKPPGKLSGNHTRKQKDYGWEQHSGNGSLRNLVLNNALIRLATGVYQLVYEKKRKISSSTGIRTEKHTKIKARAWICYAT